MAARRSTPRTPTTPPRAAKRAASKKPGTKKAAAKKAAPAKVGKKVATKKAGPKKASTKKASTKKASTKKASTKKASTKKASTKKASTTKASDNKTAVSKTAATHVGVKRSGSSRTVGQPSHQGETSSVRSGGSVDGRSTFFLNVGYEDRNLAKWGGATWEPTMRRWVWRGTALPAPLRRFAAAPFSWEAWLEADHNQQYHRHVGTGTIALRPHQRDAADAISAAGRRGDVGFLLADDVGLGKTYAAIDGVRRIGEGLRILVLAPLSVVPHWRRSIEAYGDGGHRWCVINYDRVKSLLETPEEAHAAVRARTKNKRIATKGRSLVEWDVVICDEAHRLKNPASQRSAAVRNLIKGHGTDAFVLWMSATAGQTPLELAYLAPLLAARGGVKVRDLNDFEQWCRSIGLRVKRGSFGQWGWDRNEEDLERMHRLLFADQRNGLRRRPQDLAGWPELVRSLAPVELDGEERGLYDEAWQEFCDALALAKHAENPTNPMVAALRFRQKASLLRVRHTATFARDLLEDGFQVAISTQFLDSARGLVDAIGNAVMISGAESAVDREAARIEFQRGAATTAVFTVCEGISLHAGEAAVGANQVPRALLVHDLRWSALDMAQIEGRCHRDGQQAIAYYLYAAETVEEQVAGAVLTRLSDMAAMLGDDRVGLDALLTLGGWES